MEHPTRPNERQRDSTLGQTLQAEASGILAWLVRGCLAWQRDGLQVPPVVRRARYDYRAEEDTLGTFLQERCCLTEGAEVRASQLYLCYKDWTVENGLKYMSGQAFGQEIKKRVTALKKQTGMFYQGLELLLETGLDAWSGTSTGGLEQWSEGPTPSPFASNESSSCAGGAGDSLIKTFWKRKNSSKKESFLESPASPSPSYPFPYMQEDFMQPVEPCETILSEDVLEKSPSPFITYEEFYL